jgi:hypothetical protein
VEKPDRVKDVVLSLPGKRCRFELINAKIRPV